MLDPVHDDDPAVIVDLVDHPLVPRVAEYSPLSSPTSGLSTRRRCRAMGHFVGVWRPGWEVTGDVDEFGHHQAVRRHDDVDGIRHHS
jgi:hypothetical protein